MGTPEHVHQGLPGCVPASRIGAGEDHRTHALSPVEQCTTERAGAHNVQSVPAPVRHIVGKDAVVGAAQTHQAEQERRNQNDEQHQKRYLNDLHLLFRVHFHCMAGLYIVATPIGNLGDITFRAVEILRTSHTIACEDTRHSRKLLSHCGISRPLLACHSNNVARCTPRILELLREGHDVAYVSDAGTPAISDPGSTIVRAVREEGFPVVPVPGPSAVTALVSVSGIAGRGWFFEGFLPPKGRKRHTRLRELLERGDPVVLYESPHRFSRLVDDFLEVAPGYHAVVGRELTKIHEQIVAGTVEEIRILVDNTTIPCRGEFVVLVWSGKCR